MKTINRRILTPFISILIVLPISILLLFNIVIGIYARTEAEHELNNTISTVRTLLQAQEITATENTGARKTVLQTLSAALTASQLSGNIQFYILNRNNRILYPRNQASTVMNADFQTLLKQNPLPVDGTVVRRDHSGGTYYMAAEELRKYGDKYNLTLLFVSTGNIARSLVNTINTTLILIICFTTVISIIITSRVAHSISQPLVSASGYAKKIGEGEFTQIPVDIHTKEINEFCISINDMARRLEAYDRAQKMFLQSASHELRTPLMSIQGYAEGIENDILPDSKQAASIIRKESIRLNTLVNELLTLSRIENQTYGSSLSQSNLSNLILDNIQRINGLALKENIAVKPDLDPEVTASVDESLMSQVIINIISNCIRYAKSTIWVRVHSEDGHAVVLIEDDGRGFSEDDLTHGFDRFYKGSGGNFGLGLSIAKSAVEYMHGEISLYNGETGAAFKIVL